MRGSWILSLAAIGLLATTPGLAEKPAAEHRLSLGQALAEADSRELFLRCCWALGRAGFHHCKEYGVCKSDAEATSPPENTTTEVPVIASNPQPSATVET